MLPPSSGAAMLHPLSVRSMASGYQSASTACALHISIAGGTMSFLLCCPHCGGRSVYEFRLGGEVRQRPEVVASPREWAGYLYARKNESGVQKEWWYHHLGCRTW